MGVGQQHQGKKHQGRSTQRPKPDLDRDVVTHEACLTKFTGMATIARGGGLNRDAYSSNRHSASAYCGSMIPRVEPEALFCESRHAPRIKSGAGFFGIMR
jgi:hypothetical protein